MVSLLCATMNSYKSMLLFLYFFVVSCFYFAGSKCSMREDTKNMVDEEYSPDAKRRKLSEEIVGLEDGMLEEYPNQVNTTTEISRRITDWVRFGRILDTKISFLNSLKIMYQECSEKNRTINRNKDIMREALKNFKEKNKHSDRESWKFWRKSLIQFNDGKDVVKEMEREFPSLIFQVSTDFAHKFTSNKISFVGHPIYFDDFFEIQKCNSEINVNIGSNILKSMHFQDIQEWTETQQRYIDIYNMFKDKEMFNFHDLNECCPILNTMGQYLSDTSDKGFVMKGCHPVDHLKWFDKNIFVDDDEYEHYFCLFAKENLIINFTKCNKQPGHALHYSSQKIRIMNALHEELRSKDIIQVNILVRSNDAKIDFCSVCNNEYYYVNESIFTDINKFKQWFEKLHKTLYMFRCEANLSTATSNSKKFENLKKEIITYEALVDAEVFPTFSRLGETQMNEMKKCVILPTLVQFTILHMNEKHIFIRGSYGSGKTIVVRRKFEKCLSFVKEEDIFYYICGDQQSDYKYSMESVKSEYSGKNIITCDSRVLVDVEHLPNLSAILKHISHFWKDKTVHVFIDEFSGLYITKREVSEIKEIIQNHFSNSYITVALQSMEEYSDEDVETDFGYQYDLLTKDTSFKVCNLDYSLRCSLEINEFVKITSNVLEKDNIPVFQIDSFVDRGRVVDKEHGQELNVFEKESGLKMKQFAYNFPQKSGHSSSNGQVFLFMCDKFNSNNSLISEKSDASNAKLIYQVYLTALDHILKDSPHCFAVFNNKKVICTYDEELYNSVYEYLEATRSLCWTHDIKKFIEKDSPYDVLLTDYASVRGYEFTNFIFLLRLGKRFLKYRMIECFTRATTKLCIITDNMNDESVDNQLFKQWRSISEKYVACVDISYYRSKDEIRVGNDMILEKTYPAATFTNRYPWRKPVQIKEKDIKNDLHQTILYICANDNCDLLCEFMKIHQLDIFNYRGGDRDESLLHLSSRAGGVNITQYLLLQDQFDVNMRDGSQRSPLHCASLSGHVDVIQLLIDNNADMLATNESGQSAIHFASENGHVGAVQLLINSNADINAKRNGGESPLHEATKNGHVDVIQLLINNNADINSKNKNGQSPLHWASWYGFVNVAHLIIGNNGDIHAKDTDGLSALHWASWYGHASVVQLLIEKNADIYAKDKTGQTPLHWASVFGKTDVVQIFVNRNADILVKDNRGRTPLDRARNKKNDGIIKLLEQLEI